MAGLNYSDILRYADDHPDMEPRAVGLAMTAPMTKAQLRDWAAAEVCDAVESHRRSLARQAEDRAAREAAASAARAEQQRKRDERGQQRKQWEQERAAWMQRQSPRAIRAWAKQDRGQICESTRRAYAEAHGLGYVPQAGVRANQADHGQREQERLSRRDADLGGYSVAEFEALRDDPAAWIGHPLVNASARRSFRRWTGAGFGTWYKSAREAVMASEDEGEIRFFDSSWYPDGPEAYYRSKRLEATYDLIKQVAAETRLQVTAELLGTKFALGDGSMITWGEATISQHRQRVAMLVANAAGVVETAARHEAAIHMCEEAGVVCLGELELEDRDLA